MDAASRSPIATEPVSVVLPAHNAAADLEEVVRSWVAVGDELKRPCEILLVDDGSTDDTAARADTLALQFPQLHVLRHTTRRGVGAALRTGIAAAKHPLLCYTLCNKQYQPADLKRLLEHIDKVDVVTGYRVWRPLPHWRVWLDRLYRGFVRVIFGLSLDAKEVYFGRAGCGRRWLARWLFGVRVRDPECLFTLCRRSIFARIPIQTDGDFAPIEALAKANFLGAWMSEVPVSWIPPTVLEPPPSKEARKHARHEIRRLLRHPDFGPPVLPPMETPTMETPTASPPAEPGNGTPSASL
jgi:glycosyltransferase involved in cell wall biosynthesis